MHYDYLVVGAGLYGAVFAERAKAAGKKVLVIEKRNHIAGNVFTDCIEGIHVHRYGAHIFHTNSDAAWEYINRFAKFNDYINSPIANYKGEMYNLPFNMNTFHQMWGVTTPEEAKAKIEEDRQKSIEEFGGDDFVPQNLEQQAVSLVGREIYEKLIKGYTEKQWGRPCNELPSFIIKRLPVRFEYDNNYFNAKYQGIPIGGYTALVERMLEGVEVRLGVDYLANKLTYDELADTIVYTGPIDAYFGYKLGALQYRSVRFEEELLDVADYQHNAVINYTDSETPYTRIIEHKWFEFGKDENGRDIPKTVISKEYSSEWKVGDEPYYPVNDERNQKLYLEYQKLAAEENGVIFGGRLGEYKYYDMDQVILAALEKSPE
ncbi:MAG: UDP-galactopyranose mutase [Eubacterium sp.]|nr:UDP-galactopyranose mutase [Eubacterium sp.]